jgi:hypothetical protein
VWQEGAIATLVAFLCFALIGYDKPRKVNPVWPAIALTTIVLWFFLAYPELVAFFAIATTGLCAGAMLAVESRREFFFKGGIAVALIAAFLALGLHNYVLNLFLYTPQMFYGKALSPDFMRLSPSTSVLYWWVPLGLVAVPLVAFFGFAALGAVFAFRFGNSFARRAVFGALALEVFIFMCGAINVVLNLVPLNLFYAEQMGLTVAALLAGTGVWVMLLFLVGPVVGRANLSSSGGSTAIGLYTNRSWSFVVLICMAGYLFYVLSGPSGFINGWPPATDSVPAQIQAKELAIKPGEHFKGRAIILLATQKDAPAYWVDAFNVHYYKFRGALGNDLMNDAEIAGIPVMNEYGHWMSPPMLALLSVAFYRPEDHIDRAAQVPRAFRPNLARLMGVSFALTDGELSGEVEIYRGSALDHPLYMYRIVGANVGDFSPTMAVLANSAAQIVDYLQPPDFDGRKVVIAEEQISENLVQADSVDISLHKGPRIHVKGHSTGTSLVVLPFEFSYCLEVEGTGLDRIVPVNLAQIGLIIRGSASLDISYRYGLLSGTACRKRDLQRIDKLGLAEVAPGRLFYSPRASIRN